MSDPNIVQTTPLNTDLVPERHEGPIGEKFDYADHIEEKILFVLRIYPRISPTMLQVGLGTSVSSKMWRPILDALIRKGLVKQEYVQETSPADRIQSYTVISLKGTTVTA